MISQGDARQAADLRSYERLHIEYLHIDIPAFKP
jgi:hypothetical protein